MKHDHGGVLDKVRHELPTDELLCDLSDLFKLFGDTTRIKILFSLFESEMCVCAIAELLGMTQSAISHQLRILEELDCANCAAKLERAVAKIEGVRSVTVSFLTQKLTLEADDGQFDEIFEQVVKTFRKIEPDCAIKR